MNVLIVTSTMFEISKLILDFKFIEKEDNLYFFSTGKFSITILISGIGAVNTAYNLTKYLINTSYNVVINVGICGSFNNNIPIGTVINVVSDQFGDFGINDNGNFKTIFDENLIDKNKFPFQDGVLKNNSGIYKEYFVNDLKTVNSITVNTASGDENSIKKLIEKFNPDIENMEGATFFYICMMENIPFYQIRAVSNYVEPRNRNNWNIELAINNLNLFLIDFLKRLKSKLG
jgi:futalosine hydrolase